MQQVNQETLIYLVARVRQRHSRLADSSVVIVVKLIKRVLLHAHFPFSVQIGAIVIKRIKVLSYAPNKLLEARVGLRTSSVWTRESRAIVRESPRPYQRKNKYNIYLLEVLQEFRKLSSPTGQQGAFLVAQTLPVKVSVPRMLDDLLESILKVRSILGGTDTRLRPSQ